MTLYKGQLTAAYLEYSALKVDSVLAIALKL